MEQKRISLKIRLLYTRCENCSWLNVWYVKPIVNQYQFLTYRLRNYHIFHLLFKTIVRWLFEGEKYTMTAPLISTFKQFRKNEFFIFNKLSKELFNRSCLQYNFTIWQILMNSIHNDDRSFENVQLCTPFFI